MGLLDEDGRAAEGDAVHGDVIDSAGKDGRDPAL
jgi:hypothetical protein